MFDYSKPPRQLLAELINTDNGTNLLENLVEFTGLATVEEGDKNTEITVAGAVGSGYNGSVNLNYDRVLVSGFVGTVETLFVLEDEETIHEILPQINQLLNINLTAADVVDGPLPDFGNTPNEIQPIRVNMDQLSLVYLGYLDVQVSNGELDLVSVLTVTELNGFFIDPSQVVDEGGQPVPGPEVMVVRVTGPVTVTAPLGTSGQWSEDLTSWTNLANGNQTIGTGIATEKDLYFRITEGTDAASRRLTFSDIQTPTGNFLGVTKWWNSLAGVGLVSQNNFTVPNNLPPQWVAPPAFSLGLNRAVAFNQDISGWDVSNITSMTTLFNGLVAFNQDISGWDVSNVTNAANTFNGATSFNQDLSSWHFPLIAEKPVNFDNNTPAWVKEGRQPIFGLVDIINGTYSITNDAPFRSAGASVMIDPITTKSIFKFSWLSNTGVDPQGWNFKFDINVRSQAELQETIASLVSIQIGNSIINSTSKDWEGNSIIEQIKTWPEEEGQNGFWKVVGTLELEPSNQTAPLVPEDGTATDILLIVKGRP